MSARDLIKQTLWHVAGVAATIPIHPACISLIFVSMYYWSYSIYVSLSIALMIAVADFILRQAIWFHTNALESHAAAQAIHLAEPGYKIRQVDIYSIKGLGIADKNDLGLKDFTLFELTPRDGFCRFTDLRAFLTVGGPNILIPAARSLGPIEKFFILHELGHGSEIGHYQSLSSNYHTYRLALIYLPLLALSNSWIVWFCTMILFLFHRSDDGSGVLIELEADWSAYKMYNKLYDKEYTISALESVSQYFKFRASLDEQPKTYLIRSLGAELFRGLLLEKNPKEYQRRLLTTNSIGVALNNMHWFLAFILTIGVILTSVEPNGYQFQIIFAICIILNSIILIQARKSCDSASWDLIVQASNSHPNIFDGYESRRPRA